ncbi:hypothetical protein Ddye_016232 [Dipteronia dyeriana]|uniref:Secreted protein n=1 Tax=Dipteronia dyeriana TaxID=168575 RepID=A0AAD9U740_9ROSI|nr:hypothetical protein Ddye_016232 [Dipteronia dyeriana]
MMNSPMLSVSLTLLILFHGSLASGHHQSQQQQLNKCQVDRLNALEPTNRVEYEARTSHWRFWQMPSKSPMKKQAGSSTAISTRPPCLVGEDLHG